MKHEEARKCHLQLRDTIDVDPEMAQMLELWDSDFKSHDFIFKYVKEPWGKGRTHAWTVEEFEQGEGNNKKEWNRNIKDTTRNEQYGQWA